ncbi:MAG: N-6 DNA methylase [Limisphaerales bacterium]
MNVCITIYGQGSNATTRLLAVMNLALRGINAHFGPEDANTFRRRLYLDVRADYVLANPPFNDSDWFRMDHDVRWQFGVPPKGNAHFAWMQHYIYDLMPHTAMRDSAILQREASPQVVSEAKDNMAGFVLANGRNSSNQSDRSTCTSANCHK